MLPTRTAVNLLLALILVINGVVGVGMATGMAAGAPSASDKTMAVAEAHGGCYEAAAKANAHLAEKDASSPSTDCCADGRCACACVHHVAAGLSATPSLMASVAFPAVRDRDVVAPLGRRLAPGLRPPIAPVS